VRRPGRVLSASHRAQEAVAVGGALGATPGYRASRKRDAPASPVDERRCLRARCRTIPICRTARSGTLGRAERRSLAIGRRGRPHGVVLRVVAERGPGTAAGRHLRCHPLWRELLPFSRGPHAPSLLRRRVSRRLAAPREIKTARPPQPSRNEPLAAEPSPDASGPPESGTTQGSPLWGPIGCPSGPPGPACGRVDDVGLSAEPSGRRCRERRGRARPLPSAITESPRSSRNL
jgi:hypothetical protein